MLRSRGQKAALITVGTRGDMPTAGAGFVLRFWGGVRFGAQRPGPLRPLASLLACVETTPRELVMKARS